MEIKDIDSVTCELFTSARCNLACTYCYIPTNGDFAKKLQRRVLDDIDSGKLFEDVKKIYKKENLKYLSHWGTEPTLTLPRFKKFYEDVIDYFPNFRNIMISSNFMTSPTVLANFIKQFNKNRKIYFVIQLSLDGPPWICDRNRVKGSTKKIVSNFFRFLELIKDEDFHNVQLNAKSTISDWAIKLLADREKFIEYFNFYDEIVEKASEITKDNKNVNSFQICSPTLAVPMDYTKEDGLNYAKIVGYQFEFEHYFKHVEPTNIYLERLKRLKLEKDSYIRNPQRHHCSAGAASLALGLEKVHLCHRSYFEGEEDFPIFDSETSKSKNLNEGRVKLLREKYSANINNDFDRTRLLYLAKCYHGFGLHRFNVAVNIIREMALANEISPCYKDPKMAANLVIFAATLECSMESILNYGTTTMNHHGLFRIFGNGACEQIISNLKKE